LIGEVDRDERVIMQAPKPDDECLKDLPPEVYASVMRDRENVSKLTRECEDLRTDKRALSEDMKAMRTKLDSLDKISAGLEMRKIEMDAREIALNTKQKALDAMEDNIEKAADEMETRSRGLESEMLKVQLQCRTEMAEFAKQMAMAAMGRSSNQPEPVEPQYVTCNSSGQFVSVPVPMTSASTGYRSG
jgi:chromosome segregation ATPase